LIAGLIARHRVVMVVATAGSGKTTAVVEAVPNTGSRVAWLTLDETDGAPGRLLTYLEAAIGQVDPAVRGTVAEALAAGLSHTEAAGLLAEALEEAGEVVLVLDELERVAAAEAGRSVISSFVRYAPSNLRVVLVGRQEPRLDLGSDVAGAVVEEDLAFTTAEAARVLAELGRTDIDAHRAVEVTSGWVTGVLFEAWTATDHVVGSGGERDPLSGYLSLQIMDRLSEAERDFLIRTSVLGTVTAARAEALGQKGAGAHLASLRNAHIPVNWDAKGRAMRCHTRFREYLLAALERLGREEVGALRRATARVLASEGLHEEAVEQFLMATAPEEAQASAEIALEQVIERLDFNVAERWLNAMVDQGPSGAGALTAAELMVAVGREQYRRGARIADQLALMGERDSLAQASARAAATMVWCYFHVGRLEDAQAVAALGPKSTDLAAAHYLLSLADERPLDAPPPAMTGSPLDALIMRVHSVRGHLALLEDAPVSRWAQAVMAPWRISALRATGQTERAFELYSAARSDGAPQGGLQAIVAVEILIDLGRRDDALDALRSGRELVERTGSRIFEMQTRIVEAKLKLQLDHDPGCARGILEGLATEEAYAKYCYVREAADTWYGLALLRQGEDGAACACLAAAVTSMVRSDRIMDLPRAAIYLAEAHWRCGNEDAADAAATLALEASTRQGSRHLLLQALTDFPAVLSRCIDTEPHAGSGWHDIGRALRAQGAVVSASIGTVVELQEFGTVAVLVDGETVHPGLAKSVGLLAYLACHEGRATREELLDAFFDGRTDASARAYLRQATHRLRQALGEELGPDVVNGWVKLADHVRVATESNRYEALLAEAARLQGDERLAATLRALEVPDRGPYLPGVASSRWIEERREMLAHLTVTAESEAAELALATGRYELAERLADRILGRDPFREGAWRVRMRLANALGDDDDVIASFRRCREALAEVGATPSHSTRVLLEQLRR